MIETARLPPIYIFMPLAADDDPLARACALAAGGSDPATILCADRPDLFDCAVILQPDTALGVSRLVLYVGMLGLGDALGSVVPAGVDVTYRWPNRIDANIGAVGRIRLCAPEGATDSEIPAWLVLHAAVAISGKGEDRSGGFAFGTTLADEGAVEVTTGALLESFSRHFLAWLGRWQDDGFPPIRAMWLRHAASHGQNIEIRVGRRRERGLFRDIDDRGALLLDKGRTTRRISLDAVLDA